MGEIIATTQFKREPGFLYYIGTDKNGYLTICKAIMARNGRHATEKKKKRK